MAWWAPMHRIFWGTAVVVLALQLAAISLRTRPAIGAAAVATLGLHATACLLLGLSEQRIGSLVRASNWPDWMTAQSEKNRRKAVVYVLWGGTLIAVSIALSGIWQTALASASLAFHLGAFLAEGLLIAAQGRLLREYEARGVAERSARSVCPAREDDR